MIKAIIFDCFGVIYSDTLGAIEGQYLTVDDARRQEIRSLRQKTDLGQLSREEFWNQAAQILGITRSALDRDLENLEGADWQLLDYVKSLKSRYKTALLSNVGQGFLERIFDSEHPKTDYFDIVIASADIGVLKPDPRSFQAVAEKLSVKTAECVMIDDQERHILGARAVGMKGLIYQNFEQAKQDLEQILSQN